MTVTGLDNPARPDHPDPENLAVIGVAGWLREDRAAAEEHEEAMRADTHRHEMQRHMETADRALADASARVSGLTDKLNLDGRRMLAFWLGGAIIIALVMLDAIPLNWAAQAFGLNAAGSWVVTMILLAASVGAMAGLEATRHDARRYTALVVVMLTAYAGLVALRTSFLVTVAGEAVDAALLQAVVLSAISAGLVFLGSAVMARTRPLRLSRALAATRRARRVLRSQRGGVAPGRGEAVPPSGRAAPAADQTAVVLRGATRGDPWRMGSSPGTRTSRSVRGAVSAASKPPLDRLNRRQVGETVPVTYDRTLTLAYDEDAGQVVLEGLPGGPAGEAGLSLAEGIELLFDCADGRLSRVIIDAGEPGGPGRDRRARDGCCRQLVRA